MSRLFVGPGDINYVPLEGSWQRVKGQWEEGGGGSERQSHNVSTTIRPLVDYFVPNAALQC